MQLTKAIVLAILGLTAGALAIPMDATTGDQYITPAELKKEQDQYKKDTHAFDKSKDSWQKEKAAKDAHEAQFNKDKVQWEKEKQNDHAKDAQYAKDKKIWEQEKDKYNAQTHEYNKDKAQWDRQHSS